MKLNKNQIDKLLDILSFKAGVIDCVIAPAIAINDKDIEYGVVRYNGNVFTREPRKDDPALACCNYLNDWLHYGITNFVNYISDVYEGKVLLHDYLTYDEFVKLIYRMPILQSISLTPERFRDSVYRLSEEEINDLDREQRVFIKLKPGDKVEDLNLPIDCGDLKVLHDEDDDGIIIKVNGELAKEIYSYNKNKIKNVFCLVSYSILGCASPAHGYDRCNQIGLCEETINSSYDYVSKTISWFNNIANLYKMVFYHELMHCIFAHKPNSMMKTNQNLTLHVINKRHEHEAQTYCSTCFMDKNASMGIEEYSHRQPKPYRNMPLYDFPNGNRDENLIKDSYLSYLSQKMQSNSVNAYFNFISNVCTELNLTWGKYYTHDIIGEYELCYEADKNVGIAISDKTYSNNHSYAKSFVNYKNEN